VRSIVALPAGTAGLQALQRGTDAAYSCAVKSSLEFGERARLAALTFAQDHRTASPPPGTSGTHPRARGTTMATLSESQAFLDQFDKCLPLCERGDAVTVVNALHSLNEITQAGLKQALELDPDSGQDFVCSFLLELELALELYISPSKKLGTIDGGLPMLYTYNDEELTALADAPSLATKGKVRKFLDALGVAPSSKFEARSVKDAVCEFMAAQVKPSKAPVTVQKERDCRSISWADLCSSGSDSGSDSDEDLLLLEEDDDDEVPVSTRKPEAAADIEREACEGFFGAGDYEHDKDDQVEEEEGADGEESDTESVASSIFLWAVPVKHTDLNTDDCSPRTAAHNKAVNEARRTRALYPFFKTVMCKNYPNCKYGDRCNFAHGEKELRRLDETILNAVARPKSPDSDTSSQTGSDRRSESGSSAGGGNNFKTRMCKNYEKNGFCKFGDRCNFAHGRDELRRGERAARNEQNEGGRSSPCGSQDGAGKAQRTRS